MFAYGLDVKTNDNGILVVLIQFLIDVIIKFVEKEIYIRSLLRPSSEANVEKCGAELDSKVVFFRETQNVFFIALGLFCQVQALYSPLHKDYGAAARSLAKAYTAMLRHFTGKLDASIQVTDHPLELDLIPVSPLF